MNRAMQTLLTGMIDYAGLFPPAKKSMSDALSAFNRARMGEDAFALSRFVCTASRLEELTEVGRMMMPGTYATSGYREMAQASMSESWEISAVLDGPIDEAMDRVLAFNERHASEEQGLARVSAVEFLAKSPGEIEGALDAIPESMEAFVEVPQDVVIGGDPRGFIAAIAGEEGASAKIRCGGVKAEMIPPTDDVAAFIMACSAANVSFKATAGLHHPIRAEQALTYEADPPRAIMHGFVNVFVAAAMARGGKADASVVKAVLDETDASAFSFSDDGVRWRDLRRARELRA